MSEIRTVDIVIPVFNEEAMLPELFARLESGLQGLGREWRAILVDDGSRDRTWEILAAKSRSDPRYAGVRLARNFGQHAAVLAGFAASRADAVLTMDADLQTAPTEAGKVLAKLDEGYDMVGGWREDRKDSFKRRFFSRWMNRIVSRATGVKLKDYGCMFRAYRGTIVRQMAESGGIASYVPSLALTYTDRVAEVPVEHEERRTGKSRYSFRKLFGLLVDLLTSTSSLPLRTLTFFGAILAASGALAGLTLVVLRIIHGSAWAGEGVFTLFALEFFLVGAQFLAFGLLGEYIGRIYNEVRGRPRFVVRETARTEEKRP
jgi:undecaprenyl-phosphate 4-deoxy-4-formamido-L-arabinose transferase